MSAYGNLLRDDFQIVAKRVLGKVRKDGATLVRVFDTGRVRYELPGRIGEVPTKTVIGIYHRQTQIEQVEDDLLARLRELRT